MFSGRLPVKMRPVIRWFLLLLLTAIPTSAQEVPDQVPMEFEGRVLDQTRVFDHEPERRTALSERLADLAAATGFEVRVVLFDSLIGSTPKKEAERFRTRLGADPGMVMVVECDRGDYALAWSEPRMVEGDKGGTLPVAGRHDLSQAGRLRVEKQLASLSQPQRQTPETIVRMVEAAATSIEDSFREAAEPADPTRMLKLLVLGTGLVAAILLVGLLASVMLRKNERHTANCVYFPKVTVGMRLGAPCGGGRVSSRTFGALPRKKA